MVAHFFVGEYGSLLRVAMPFDASQATAVSLLIRKPSGQTVSWQPSSVSAAAIERTFADGDLDEGGTYSGVVIAQFADARRKARFTFQVAPAT